VSASLIPVVLVLAFLFGVSLGLARFRFAMACGVALCVAPAVVVAVNVIVAVSRDPTSHNLWPFEILVAAAAGLIPGAGLFLGWLIRKVVAVPAWVPAGVAAVLAVFSPLLSNTFDRRDDTEIRATLKRLWQAQMSYANAEPRHRFACEGPMLPGFERDPWLAQVNEGPLRNWLPKGAYSIIVRCSPGHFRVQATPRRRIGGFMYCVDESGIVDRAPVGSGSVCGLEAR
jgi:hypothetical protein